MRVVQVVPSLAVGGLERVATTLTLRLHERDTDVVVCTRGAYDDHTLQELLERAGVPLVRIPRPRPRPRDLVAAALAIAPVLRKRRPDAIHAHNPGAAIAAALARTLARARETAIVTTYHGLPPEKMGPAMRVLSLTSDLVTGIGPTATGELAHAGFPRERLVTVRNATDAAATRPRDEVRREFGLEDAEIVTTVGRYVEEKNQALQLEALAVLAPERPRLRGMLVGVGPLRDELDRRAHELGIHDRVLLTGARADAIDIVAASDVLTLTSTREGLGLTLIEAMAVGTPVVATAVGGIVDVVVDDETGLLVSAGDVHGLARAIARLLDDDALRARLVARGRARVEAEFSVDAMVDGYLAAYSTAASRRRTRVSARRAGASPSK